MEEFARTRIPLEKAETDRIVPIDVAKIDPTRFNIVDAYLKWRVFRRCTRIIPSYAKAKEIFDFCAQLSCHLPGPYALTPCIPFQYVRDGCYARAHQMRRIITTRYGYCCEKVFSFAPRTTTAGRAGEQMGRLLRTYGGTTWRRWSGVRLKSAYPAPRGTSRSCRDGDRPRHVRQTRAPEHLAVGAGEQELQPACKSVGVFDPAGSAYTPGWNGPFGTDPNYTQTEATLINYRNLTTC